jgi:4-hydroxy-tetrahydrodipicolinate reductase
MGQAIAASVRQQPDFELVGLWQRGQDLGEMVAAADVVIDFSLPEGTERVLEAVERHGKPLVCGVTGLNESQLALLVGASDQVPLVFDRNMSLGIALLEKSVREAAASLGADFAVRVSEVHHVHKKDAPSGTALKLGEAIASSRGETGTGAVQFEIERRGDIPGDHEVTMASTTEKLTFAHSVTTRQVFVDGALAAAAWVIGKAPGRYSIQDVLFSPSNS